MPEQEEFTAEKLDQMMRKVQGLLAKADDPAATPQEADSCRATAERIMRKYRIAEEELRSTGALIGNQFDVQFHEVKVYGLGSHYAASYQSMVSYAMYHCDVQGVWTGYKDGERIITMVGYEADVRYAESLFLQARLLFADRMEPKVDPSLSDEDNVYRLRSAGMERSKVGLLMGWGGEGTKGPGKVTRLYKKACLARGENPTLTGRSFNVKDFREGYAEGFTNTFWENLWRARQAIDAELDGGGLVLHGRKERVLEAMYQRWPELRPDPNAPKPKARKYKGPTKAEMAKQMRMSFGAGAAGSNAGTKAASEINIKQPTPKRRLDQ